MTELNIKTVLSQLGALLFLLFGSTAFAEISWTTGAYGNKVQVNHQNLPKSSLLKLGKII